MKETKVVTATFGRCGPFPSAHAGDETVLSGLYGTLAARRRRWYEARPEVRRRLRCPVVSVGSLTVGGSGKTPVAADVAKVLVSIGEHPALLSRGYRRTDPRDGVVVVSVRGAIKSDLGQAGDEAFMLASQLADVSVLVSDDRYLAGQLAETHLGATVHVLDDGFQHLSLHRDVDLLVVGDDDLADPRTLPGGRLREPVDAAVRVDALVVEAQDADRARAVAQRVGVEESFYFAKTLDRPRDAADTRETEVPNGARVLALAGIAKPQGFVEALRATGYDVADVVTVRDHHPYSARDLNGIADRVRRLGVDYVMTTEKDFVRLRQFVPLPFPLVWMPLRVSVEPSERFGLWMVERLVSIRGTSAEGARLTDAAVGEAAR